MSDDPTFFTPDSHPAPSWLHGSEQIDERGSM